MQILSNGQTRFYLSGAGLMEIRDSGGAAVFTFNTSAGAEFTKPLTLGTAGGIYQGTGTFGGAGVSLQTGLKIWNERRHLGALRAIVIPALRRNGQPIPAVS